jgi:hypothetical protein
MANPDHIITRLIETAISMVPDPDIRQDLPILQGEGLIAMKFLHTADSKFMVQNKNMHELPLQKSFYDPC